MMNGKQRVVPSTGRRSTSDKQVSSIPQLRSGLRDVETLYQEMQKLHTEIIHSEGFAATNSGDILEVSNMPRYIHTKFV